MTTSDHLFSAQVMLWRCYHVSLLYFLPHKVQGAAVPLNEEKARPWVPFRTSLQVSSAGTGQPSRPPVQALNTGVELGAAPKTILVFSRLRRVSKIRSETQTLGHPPWCGCSPLWAPPLDGGIGKCPHTKRAFPTGALCCVSGLSHSPGDI